MSCSAESTVSLLPMEPGHCLAHGKTDLRWVLQLKEPTYMVALQHFNKLVVQTEGSIYAYPLHVLAAVALGQAKRSTLEESVEKILQGGALFFRTGIFGQRTLCERKSQVPTRLHGSLTLACTLPSILRHEDFYAGHAQQLGSRTTNRGRRIAECDQGETIQAVRCSESSYQSRIHCAHATYSPSRCRRMSTTSRR
jgi:hypothetical protein